MTARDDRGLIPEAGDLVYVKFDPAFGREQSGERPGLVLSPGDYNRNSSFVLVCPITSNPKPWPFKFDLGSIYRVSGFVLVDQIKSIDRGRLLRVADRADEISVRKAQAMLIAHLNIPPGR